MSEWPVVKIDSKSVSTWKRDLMKVFSSLQFWVSLCLIFAGLLAVVSMKYFWGEPHKWVGASEALQLTETQKEQLKAVFEESHKDHEAVQEGIHSREEDFRAAISDASKTPEQLEALFTDLDRSRSQMGRRRFEMTLKIREIIGAQKMRDFRRSHRPPRGRGRRGQGGRGEEGHHPPPPPPGHRPDEGPGDGPEHGPGDHF